MNFSSTAATSELADQLEAIVGKGYLIRDEETRRPYECDALPVYKELPMLVVMPANRDEVQAVMRLCHRHRVPVVARGAGTGLCAGAMPSKEGVLLSMTRLSRIIAIDAESRIAKVEPGVTNLAISETASKYGLYYAPDPSSQIACTIGGNIAENSGGVHCLKYGLTVHNVAAIEMVTAEGEVLQLGGRGFDSPGYDLNALFIGSEGLLGIVTEVQVRLLPQPEAARVVMAAFANVQDAGNAVGAVIAQGIIPAGLEMMDGFAIQAAEDFAQAGYPRDANALLLCELDGSAAEVEEHIQNVQDIFYQQGATSCRASESEAERALLWKGRKSAFPAVGRLSPDYYCMDGTIPRSKLAEVLLQIQKLSEEYGLKVANVFHAGDGNLHPLILFDANKPGELEKTEEFGGKILEMSVEVGGCITGEHGVGYEKIQYMFKQFSDAELGQFHAIKHAFDSNGMLNPGKGVPVLRQCQEYRSIEKQPPSEVDHG